MGSVEFVKESPDENMALKFFNHDKQEWWVTKCPETPNQATVKKQKKILKASNSKDANY